MFNISQLVHNGKIVQDPKQIAKTFNNVFINIAAKIDSDIPRIRKSPLAYLGCKLEHSFFFSHQQTQQKLSASSLSLKMGKL